MCESDSLVWRWLPPRPDLLPPRFLASLFASRCFELSFGGECVFPPKGGVQARLRVVGDRARALEVARALEAIADPSEQAAAETEGLDSYGAPVSRVGNTSVESRFTPAEAFADLRPLSDATANMRPVMEVSGDEAVLHLSTIKAEVVTAFLAEAARSLRPSRYMFQHGAAARRHGFAFAAPSDRDRTEFLRVARAHFPNARVRSSQKCV